MVEDKIPGGLEYGGGVAGMEYEMYPFACDMGPHNILECGRKSCQGGGASGLYECKAGVSKSIYPFAYEMARGGHQKIEAFSFGLHTAQ